MGKMIFIFKKISKLIFPTHTLSQSSFTHTCLGVLSFYGVALHLRILLTSASVNIRPGCCPFFSCLGYVLFLDGLTGKGTLFVMHFLLVLRSSTDKSSMLQPYESACLVAMTYKPRISKFYCWEQCPLLSKAPIPILLALRSAVPSSAYIHISTHTSFIQIH